MTYMKPELVELMSAAGIIQSGQEDSNTGSKQTQVPEGDTSSDTHKSSTSGAYQADE
jgi:hypothetical protein